MGLLDLFRKDHVIVAPKQIPVDEASLVELNKINEAIELAMQKTFNLNDFQIDRLNDQGGYFGREFDIRSTAGRLKGAYASEPWVYIAADKIARTLSSVQFKVRDVTTKDELPNHPLNQVVNGGNADTSGYTVNWNGYTDLILGGNYLKAFDDNFQIATHYPIEYVTPKLREINPQNEQLIKERGIIESFEFSMGPGKTKHNIPYEQTVFMKLPNPFTNIFGFSPFTSAARPILLDRNKNEFELAFYLRGATNAGVIETSQDISKSRMSRLMATFEQSFTGKRNWWRTLFLPKGAKWVNSGLTMTEMQHLEGLRENRLTILAVLGIPPSQVGIVQDVNRATAETQEASFWQNTILPLTQFISDSYNNSHVVKNVYNGLVEVYADLEGHEALEGSFISRAESAKSADDILTINEQREMLGKDPHPRGDVFSSEMKRGLAAQNPGGEPQDPDGGDDNTEKEITIAAGDTDHTHEARVDENGNGETYETSGDTQDHVHKLSGKMLEDGSIEITVGEANDHTHPTFMMNSEQFNKNLEFSQLKQITTGNQDRIERTQGNKFHQALLDVLELHLDQAIEALTKEKNVASHLQTLATERSAMYEQVANPILENTMVRGFDLAQATVKDISDFKTKIKNIKARRRFTAEDEQAIEVIKERTEDGKRKTLRDRNLTAFFGFDENQSENILKIIDEGLEQGQTSEEIAGSIKEKYGENYGDQAFTISRTETLIAVSEGLQWHQDTLLQVFSKVNKQWLHVGDVGTNPDARQPHFGFEGLGEVSSDFIYLNEETGNTMAYPRDPRAGASDIINCRCSMSSVVPPDATSNANIILENA